jgi:hypothetical protein
MNRRRRAISAAAAAALAAGSVPLAFLAAQPAASAGTSACPNTPQPVSGPVGCGSLFLPWVSYSARPGNVLTMTATADAPWSPVTVEPMNGSPAQDFTFYQVCTRVSYDRVPVAPCGTAGQPEAGRFVIEYTPGGRGPAGGANSQQSLCLDENGASVTLANCQAGGSFLLPGFPYPPQTDGVPPVVQSPIAAETWVITPSGVILNARTGRRLADPRGGGPGTPLTASTGRGLATDWQASGCTSPVSSLPGRAWYGCISG